MTDSPTWTPAPLEPERREPWEPAPAGDDYGRDDHAGDDFDMIPGATPLTPGPPKRGKRRWLLAIVAILVLALVAAAVWVFLLRPPASADGAAGAVVDLTEAPDEAWTYRYAPRGDEEWIGAYPVIRPVGGDTFVVLASLDSEMAYAQGESTWYDGYDAHYDTGYADGLLFREAELAYYQNSWSNSYPDREDYFSLEGTSYSSAAYNAAYQGWTDGFDDAEYDRPEGASRAERPDPPPTLGFVAGVDRGSGEELWQVDLESLDVESTGYDVALSHVSPEGHVVVSVTEYEYDEEYTSLTTFTALDPSDGSIVSQSEFEGVEVATGGSGSGAFIVLDEEGVMRLDTGDLGGDYLWSASIPGLDLMSGAFLSGEYVSLSTDEGRWWLEAATGFEPEWFEDADPEVNYRIVGEEVLRLESSSFGYYIDALDRDGTTLWTSDAEKVLTPTGSGGPVLLVGEAADPGEDYLMDVEYLMRLDPRTGEAMWEEEYDGPLGYATGTVPGGVVLGDGDRSVVLDLETGERTQRLRGRADHLGTTVAYGSTDGRVRAWDLAEGSELWALRVSDDEFLTTAGDALFVQDTVRREISLLE